MPVAKKKLTAVGFAHLADDQVGKPYVLGAEASASDPNPPKFDCSELVEWLYARSGNKITDLAAAQYDVTKEVAGSPKVGDLVFLRNNPARHNGIGHVAVLTSQLANGDWRIIEARGRAYGVVRSTLSYWKQRNHYAGLRRLPSFELASAPKPKPIGKEPEFPLPSHYFFGPASGPDKSVSGTYGRKFKGRLDREWLKVWQTQAKKLGFYTGAIDGEYGPKTKAAAKAVQKRAGLSRTGLIGDKTWYAAWRPAK